MSELAMLNEQESRMRLMERTDRSVFQLRAQSALMGIPALRAAWPMSSIDYTQPECTDISGHGHHLQAAVALGNIAFGYDNTATPKFWAPVANFAGAANQYLFRADGGAANWADIGLVGGDLQILAGQQGLALGGWFHQAALVGVGQHLMSKDDGAAQRQYQLVLRNTDQVSLFVWPGPVSVTSVATINVGWNHVVGIYDKPNLDLRIVLNGVVTSNLGTAPANLVDSTAPFTIGADGAGGTRMTGLASMCFLSAGSVQQAAIRGLRQEQRNVFGV